MFNNLTIFEWVTKKELETISSLAQNRFVKKWEYLFKEWDEANSMYVVAEWEINLYKNWSYIWTMQKDSMFWEKAYLKWFNKRLMSTKAWVDTVLIVMLYSSFELFLKQHPEYKERMMKHFSSYNIDSKLLTK